MAVGTSLRSTLVSVTPTWLQNAPGFRNLFGMLYVVAMLGDCLREIAWQGQIAAYPGVGTSTANPLIADSRGLLQGPGEPDADFAARAIAFRTAQDACGSPEQLALKIQAYLCGQGSLGAGVYPVVVIFDRTGRFVRANADRSITPGLNLSWHWDNVNGYVDGQRWEPPSVVNGWWGDLWIVIQDPYTHYTSFSDPNWLAAWNSGDQTIDSLCPQSVVAAVFGLIAQWKGTQYVRNVTWVPNVLFFIPGGQYGNSSFNVGGVQTTERTATNSYWDPPGGG